MKGARPGAIPAGPAPARPAAPAPHAHTRPAPATRARNPEDARAHTAVAMLELQAGMREARTPAELAYFAVNEPRRLLRGQQIVLLARRGAGGPFAVRAVSSVTHVDRSSPLVVWFERLVRGVERRGGLAEAHELALPEGKVADGYPLRHVLWLPWLARDGQVVAGMLVARTVPWQPADVALARHLAEALAHAWLALGAAPWRKTVAGLRSPRALLLALAVAAAAMALPVPMTALAPAEVAPRGATLVTAGVEGVVKDVLVEPNASVSKGQVLVTLADTVLRNRLEIAEREVAVAETRHKKAAQSAFVDVRGRHELAVAQAELALRISERDYARELLARAEIRAERDGLAVFGDRKDLIGRPVAVGERLMEIADPAEVEFRIDLGVADAIVLGPHARVKVYLDSDPLRPVEARLARAGYQAKVRESQQLAFRLVAEPAQVDGPALRLGVRGTAQVYGEEVSLGFYLFRRPIAAARQWLGL